jgi:hypothetical protein
MAYIDPSTGGLKFIDKAESLEKASQKSGDINALFKPQKSKYELS